MSKSEQVQIPKQTKTFLVHGVTIITPFTTNDGKEVDYDALVLHIMQDLKEYGQRTEELRIINSSREVGVFKSVEFPCLVQVEFTDKIYKGKLQSVATDFELV